MNPKIHLSLTPERVKLLPTPVSTGEELFAQVELLAKKAAQLEQLYWVFDDHAKKWAKDLKPTQRKLLMALEEEFDNGEEEE